MANSPAQEQAAGEYRLPSRPSLRRDLAAMESPGVRSVWTLFSRDDNKPCHDGSDYNTCQRPSSNSMTNVAIILGVIIPVVVGAIVLLYLHRRNIRKLREEDAKDPTNGLDFGMEEPASKPGRKRKSFFGGGEKSIHKGNQLSLDMNLSSPYLLPPNMHQSRDSLARTYHDLNDPYRTVAQYANSDAGSLRSVTPSASKHGSLAPSQSFGHGGRLPPSRSDSMPKPLPRSPNDPASRFSLPKAPEPTHQPPRAAEEERAQSPPRSVAPIVPVIDSIAHHEEVHHTGVVEMPDVDVPAQALSRDSHYGMPSPPFEHDKPMLAELPAQHEQGQVGTAHSEMDNFELLPPQDHSAGLGLDMELPHILSPDEGAPGQAVSHDYHHQQDHYLEGYAADYQPEYNGDYQHNQPQMQVSQYYEEDEPYSRGRSPERQAPADGTLGVPQQQVRRLSVGARPLPPDEVMESEDPEYRANRIRSFYKEYFDVGEQHHPPMPGGRQGGGEYYEDYDSNYLGDAAYYDADTNTFVMPYAQPVTRRAMTPPPAGRFRGGPRGPGPRGGPRGPHGFSGSVSGMSLPGGRHGRAGSAFSPRPGSSASARMMRGPPKKKLPPPSALHTLPTPSKLKDDSFALFNATDFAPPDSVRDHASGRSQSPLGERRPYIPKLPVASPLATAFDELSALPSPHVLRKSSTFTNLDFAPPKKFKESDTMSDAGSIRSNRSGISAVNLNAIRSGAGRVSRLPGDMVFTAAAQLDTLNLSGTCVIRLTVMEGEFGSEDHA